MRHQSAVGEHVEKESGQGLTDKDLAARFIDDTAVDQIDRVAVALPDVVGGRTDHHGKPEVEGVAEEYPAERFRDHGRYAQDLQRLCGLLARRPHAEIAPGNDDVARTHRA